MQPNNVNNYQSIVMKSDTNEMKRIANHYTTSKKKTWLKTITSTTTMRLKSDKKKIVNLAVLLDITFVCIS